jgi:hypothetical protein
MRQERPPEEERGTRMVPYALTVRLNLARTGHPEWRRPTQEATPTAARDIHRVRRVRSSPACKASFHLLNVHSYTARSGSLSEVIYEK